MIAEASVSTSPRMPAISSNSFCVATSGGEIWSTGSPRRPRGRSGRRRRVRSTGTRAQEPLALLVRERLARVLVLHALERPEATRRDALTCAAHCRKRLWRERHAAGSDAG
jgi:hypothetical protein